jgi:hypothetical protein
MMDALDYLIKELDWLLPAWYWMDYRDKRRALLNALRLAQILRQIEKSKKKKS